MDGLLGWLVSWLYSSEGGRENPVGVKSQVCSIHFIDKLIFNAFSVAASFFRAISMAGNVVHTNRPIGMQQWADLGWLSIRRGSTIPGQ